jgi:hypothetical protein
VTYNYNEIKLQITESHASKNLEYKENLWTCLMNHSVMGKILGADTIFVHKGLIMVCNKLAHNKVKLMQDSSFFFFKVPVYRKYRKWLNNFSL